MRLARVVTPLMITALLLATRSASAQSVTNGTFSTDASGWTLSGACQAPPWSSTVGNPAGSLQLNACGENTSNPDASQTITGFTVGNFYQLTWDMALHWNWPGQPGGAGTSFAVFVGNSVSDASTPVYLGEFLDGGVNSGIGDQSANPIWHTVSTTFQATNTSLTILFSAELDRRTPGVTTDNDVSYYLDNVSLTDASVVPEPATMTLLATGLVGMVGAGMRRRKKA